MLVSNFALRDEVDAALTEPVHDQKEVTTGAAQPLPSPRNKGVSLFQSVQTLFQLRPIQRASARRFLIDTLAASLLQVAKLSLRVLLFG